MTDDQFKTLCEISTRSATAASNRLWSRHRGSLDDDLNQEAFIGAFLAHKSFHPSKGDYINYVRSYAAGRVRQFQRDFMSDCTSLKEDMVDQDVLALVDVREDLRLALMTLPEPMRKAIVFYHIFGRTQQDIAAEMKCSQKHVNRLIRRGLVLLRSALQTDG